MINLRKNINLGRIVRLFMLLLGLILAVTGIIKFLEIHSFFSDIYISLPLYQINTVHDWSGAILILLALIFFIFGNLFGKNKSSVPIKKFLGLTPRNWFFIVILIIVGAGAVIYVNDLSGFLTNRVTQLKSAEITEYQGEKLSSLDNLLGVSIKGPQYIDINTYRMEISGLVENPKSYTYAQVLDFPKYSKVVDINCVEGWSAKILWEGVLLKDPLGSTGIKPEAKAVIFYAKDGYSSMLPLDYVINNNIILASKVNGIDLPAEKGFPFQVVAESKWGYKWVKWITKIELSDNLNYRGTYESVGYSNNGDLNKSQFDTQK